MQSVASARAQAAVATQDTTLLEQARDLAETIAIPSYKETALKAVVWAFVQVGTASKDTALLEQARNLAETITNPSIKAEALRAVASGLAQAGKGANYVALLEQAHQVAKRIPSGGGSDRASNLRAIAGEFAAAGRIRFARQLAYEQNADNDKALTLATILTRASSDPFFRRWGFADRM